MRPLIIVAGRGSMQHQQQNFLVSAHCFLGCLRVAGGGGDEYWRITEQPQAQTFSPMKCRILKTIQDRSPISLM